MSDSKGGDDPKSRTKINVKKTISKLKKIWSRELTKALKRPHSKYGGPIRISSGVPLKFPYTFTAKIVQFPWTFYVRNNWIWTYYFVAVIVCIPIFKKISNLSNSPENVAKWAEQQRKEKEAEHAH